jgi:hypothetical protein
MGFVFHGKKPGRVPKGFDHFVERTETCWLWRGAVSSTGYGSYRFHGKTRKAHHVAYILTKGQLPVSGPGSQAFVVMHSCDNRLCVRPDHLRVSTQAENVKDAISKGRVPHIVGPVRRVRRKFDWDEARAYRNQGVAMQDIAAYFRVGLRAVYKALSAGG